jgi:hypothetical protein
MRKKSQFPGRIRRRLEPRGRTSAVASVAARKPMARDDADDEHLTPAAVRKLRREVADLENPIRYFLVSEMGPRFRLYYDVSDDVYVMNDPRGATLFKRRQTALAVKRLLGTGIRIVRCSTKRVDGVRVPVFPVDSKHRRTRRRPLVTACLSTCAGVVSSCASIGLLPSLCVLAVVF